MLLHSLIYFITLPLLVCIYYALPVQRRFSFLFLISLVWIGAYNLSSLVSMLALSVLNYSIALQFPLLHGSSKRNFLFYFTQLINVLSLLFLNRVAFYNNLGDVNLWNHFSVDTALFALGINYYGLQQIGYLIDVYKKRMAPEPDFTKYALYNSLVFKISAGPILKYGEYKNSFFQAFSYNEENIASGIHRILLGVFKKTVLADRLAPIAADIYDIPTNHLPAASAWFGIAAFFVQLYFDFSGYIDIALGSARLFGITLKENFNLPFRAISISDFWRRWHISLMDWLGNYVFFPVMFRLKKQPKLGTGVAIAATFLISGLWHGVGITFLVYACLHIAYMLIEFYTASWRKKYLPAANSSRFFHWGYAGFVFMLISFSLVFFRAGTIDNAARIIKYLFDVNFIFDSKIGWLQWLINGGGNFEIVFNHRITICLVVVYLFWEKYTLPYLNAKKLSIWFIVLVLVLVVFFGAFGSVQRFIYLQF